jgi:hypothetical protein
MATGTATVCEPPDPVSLAAPLALVSRMARAARCRRYGVITPPMTPATPLTGAGVIIADKE